MAVCVSVIQNGAERAFALITGDNIRFQFAAAADHPHGERIITCADFGDMRFQTGKESLIENRGSLDDLRESAEKLIVRKRLEKISVDDDRLRLVKRSDEVLAFGNIHARFAADGGIDHRKQCGGNLDEINSAHVDSGGETRHVPRHASAESNDNRAAIQTFARGGAADFKNGSNVF